MPGRRPPRKVSYLPRATFKEMAEDLFTYATIQARAAEGAEIFVARNPGHAGLEDTLQAARRSAQAAGSVHALFQLFGRHETEVRAFVEELVAAEAAPSPRGNEQEPAQACDPGHSAGLTARWMWIALARRSRGLAA